MEDLEGNDHFTLKELYDDVDNQSMGSQESVYVGESNTEVTLELSLVEENIETVGDANAQTIEDIPPPSLA